MENIRQEMPEILDKIRKYRKNKGYSHDYMAIELDISPSTYTKIERNEVKLTVERFLQIAEILDISPASFLKSSGNNVVIQNNTDFENAYVENLQQLDRELVITLKEEIIFLRKIISEKLSST